MSTCVYLVRPLNTKSLNPGNFICINKLVLRQVGLNELINIATGSKLCILFSPPSGSTTAVFIVTKSIQYKLRLERCSTKVKAIKFLETHFRRIVQSIVLICVRGVRCGAYPAIREGQVNQNNKYSLNKTKY